MKKFLVLLFGVLCCTVSLTSCGPKDQKNRIPGRIVTGIDIYCQKPTCIVDRHYTQPDKVSAVLTYLRLLRPIGPMQVTQQAMQGDLYEIVVHLQDGSHRIHRQRSGSFAAMHRSGWGRIDETLGNRLPFLMALLPSDEVSPNHTDMPQKSIRKG